MSDEIRIRILSPRDGAQLERVADGVFDGPVSDRWSAEFLADTRHHLAVAVSNDQIVGMASAVHYVHPDKGPELWINEVGVAPPYQCQGIAKRLLGCLFELGSTLGCTEAWVLTEENNGAARRLYASAGGEEPDKPVYVTFRLNDKQPCKPPLRIRDSATGVVAR